MNRYRDRCSAPRRQPSNSGIWYSEELLFGATGGFYGTPNRGSVDTKIEFYELGDTFEETVPTFSISELVRLGFSIAHRISHLRRQRSGGHLSRETRTGSRPFSGNSETSSCRSETPSSLELSTVPSR